MHELELKLDISQFSIMLGDAYCNCLDTEKLESNTPNINFKEVENIVEFILYNYFGINVE